jgi:hypothetical protein
MSSKNDLSVLLQSWQPKIKHRDDLRRGVWARIESVETRKPTLPSQLFSWLQLLASPRLAVVAVTLSLFGGVIIGGLQAHSTQEERYLLSLNPFSSHH